jgi:hypothetical protein
MFSWFAWSPAEWAVGERKRTFRRSGANDMPEVVAVGLFAAG